MFLGACLVALASQPVRAQAGGAVVIVHVTVYSARVITTISRGSAKTETTETALPTNYVKHEAPLAEVYQQVVTKLTQEGYSLKGMSGGDAVTVLVFMK